jgi:chaperone modulatory protein CbpM
MSQSRFSIIEVVRITGLDQKTLVTFIEKEWIHPCEREQLDEEDVARIKLIQDLKQSFGANDEAIPLILHLMDQLYYLRSKLSP